MPANEYDAVKEVLLRHLHETEDEELQAALWQVMAYHDNLARRLLRVRNAAVEMIGETI